MVARWHLPDRLLRCVYPEFTFPVQTFQKEHHKHNQQASNTLNMSNSNDRTGRGAPGSKGGTFSNRTPSINLVVPVASIEQLLRQRDQLLSQVAIASSITSVRLSTGPTASSQQLTPPSDPVGNDTIIAFLQEALEMPDVYDYEYDLGLSRSSALDEFDASGAH
jgi:hypothetical protein